MCGISGVFYFNSKKAGTSEIKSMLSVMKYRGPDDEGVYVKDSVGLGHKRLSIIDLSSAGHQPMFDRSGRYCIIHNGEVYNYIELRRELSNKYDFKSRTDSEVILYSYMEWGIECLKRFNGMFAFAIYDIKEERLFLARDRFGIKPLYYYWDKERFVFASEIKSILQIVPSEKAADDTVIFDYIVFNRTDQYEDTFYKKIKRLDHGCYGLVEKGHVSFNKWYSLPEHINGNSAFRSPSEFRDTFFDAVRLRLRSDVPLGVCLSGGLDSSSITSVLNSNLEKNDLQTFSAVYGQGKTGDESAYIELMKDSVYNMHRTYPSADTLYKDMESFIKCIGEPVSSTSPYAQFKVMELAKGNVTVLLDGQGADEILAGYHYFFGNYFKELLIRIRLLRFLKESFLYSKNHHSLFAFKTLIYYFLPNSVKSRAKLLGRNYINRDFFEKEQKNTRLPGTLFGAPGLKEALLNHFEYKLEHLLKWEDRNSMWFSLESRVPFLDHRLVEGTLSLPPEKIISQGMTKYILRQAMKGILPEKIRMRQDKIGFMTPESEWFRRPFFRDYILDLLNSESFRNSSYLDYKSCIKLYDLHLKRKINVSRDIWKWMNLELWFRHCC